MTRERVATRLGPLPADWSVRPLGEVTEKTASPIEVEPRGLYREIGIRSHGKGIFHKEHVKGETLGAKRVFQVVPDRLVFNIVFAWEGAVAVTSKYEAGMIASHRFPMFGPNAARLIDVEFLRRFFQTELGVRLLGDASPGGAGRNRTLNQKFAAEIPVPVPPLAEQKKIASILSSVDEAIEATQAVIDQLQVVKKAMMAELLTRGLPGRHTRFKQTEIGEVPEAWEVVPLSDVAFVQTGIAKGKGVEEGVELPYLRVANVQDGRVDLTEMKRILVEQRSVDRYSLRSGDVLFTEGGDADKLGRGCVWRGQIDPCLHQNHVFAVRTEQPRLVPEFLSYWAASPRGKAYFLDCAKQTTNLASINSTQLKAFPVPLAPPDEQAAIVRAIGSVDERTASETQVGSQLRGLKEALMSVLLTGEVRVKVDEEAT
jgi:restriction endonuclease S subunit